MVVLGAVLMLFTGRLQAQGNYAQGIVYENSKATPLVGATILFMNANDRVIGGTTTDIDGKFKALLPEGIANIGFSFIGMKLQKYPFDPAKVYDIILKEDNALLDEVTVKGERTPKADMGMMQKNRRDLVSAVSSVDMKVLQTQSVSSVEQLLQGAAPGLQVTFNSGDPGAGANIRIRGISSLSGSSSPLWVIDGAEVISDDFDVESITNFGYSPVGDIDPGDIESIDILKDAASTAIYGSRGANGVIVIKTKRGHQGKPQFNFSAKLTATMVPEKIPMLSGEQQKIFLIESAVNKAGNDLNNVYPELRGDLSRPDAWMYNNNTDWVDEISKTGFQQEYNFSLRGGGDRLNYYWGLGYTSEYGTTMGGGYDRFNTMVNLDYRLSDKLRISSKFSYTNSTTDKRSSDYPDAVKETSGDKRVIKPLAFARARAAYFPVYNQNRSDYFMLNTTDEATSWTSVYNPLSIIDNSTFLTKANRFNAAINLNFDITQKWNFYTQVSIDYRQSGDDFFLPGKAVAAAPGDANRFYNRGIRSDGYQMKLVNNNRLYYIPVRNDEHYVMLTAVADLIYDNANSMSIDYWGGASPELKEADSKAIINAMGGSKTTSTSMSLVLNAQYKLLNRYNVDMSLKTEASSRYGKDNPYSLFPTVGLAWDMKHEGFFEDKEWVDLIKPRVAFGKSGKLPDTDNLLDVTYATASDGYLGNSYTYIDKFASESVHEERTTDWNYGLDWNLFNNRFGGEFNYYTRETKDLLLAQAVPHTLGAKDNKKITNFGTIKNQGWELGVTVVPIDMLEERFRWKIYFNISRNRNKLVSLPENFVEDGYIEEKEGFKSRLVAGDVVGAFYGYRAKGVYSHDSDAAVRDFNGNVILDSEGKTMKMHYNSADGHLFQGGDMIYEDINHDGLINSLDMVQIGDANPDYYGSFRTDFNWRQWSLAVNFYYSLGQDVINGMRKSTESMGGVENQATSIEKRWRKQGDITEMPRAEKDAEWNYIASDRWVEDASYLKLKELSLTYQFDKNVLKKLHLGQLSVWVTGMNLLTWTKYKGVDPEIGVGNGISMFGVDSQNTAPPIRCTFGLRASF